MKINHQQPNRHSRAARKSWLIGIVILCLWPAIVSAQTTTYQARFFAQYAPRNALEMVGLLPGFTFDDGDNERGFGGNAGNVLIDGVRPTSKSGGISAALIRLPANQVVRIELLAGSVGEAEGHALVANVISIKSQTSGSWAMRARQTKLTEVKPNVEAVLRMPIDHWNTAFDLNIGIKAFHRTGEIEQYDNQAVLLSTAQEHYAHNDRFDYFNGEAERAFAGGKLTLNSRLAWDEFNADLQQHNRIEASQWKLHQQEHSKLGELGIDWVKATDGWKLRLIGLAVRNDAQYQYDYQQQSSVGDSIAGYYQQERLKTEYVGRATYSKVGPSDVGSSAIKPEFGFEVANNRLDTNAQSRQLGSFTPVFGSDVLVQERRSEAFINVAYQASSSLAIEGGLTYENSQIEVTGDAFREQVFDYIKPRFTVGYQMDPVTRLTFEATRRVGQLSFNDFAANTVADENRTNAGNSQLSPEHIDELATTFDWRFSERGSLKIKAYHQWRSDILEQIVIDTDDNGNIKQGLGNAGDAQLWSIRTHLKLPIDAFIPHGLIDFSHRYTQSRFDDPLIAASRDISNNTPEWFTLQFRQDLTAQQFSWGFEWWDSFSYDNYLVDEIQTIGANGVLHLFVETSGFFGVKIQLEISNANTSRQPFTRRYYQHTRVGEYLAMQVGKYKRNPYFLLSVFGEF